MPLAQHDDENQLEQIGHQGRELIPSFPSVYAESNFRYTQAEPPSFQCATIEMTRRRFQVLGLKPAPRLEQIGDEHSEREQDCNHRLA